MFDKLFSRLAINPSHLDDFLAYSNRLQKDKVLRKLSVYFVAGGIVLMIFSFLNPTEKSVSYSEDNIINGISTKEDILTQWDNPQADIAAIYSRFGVTRQDIANLPDKPNAAINPSSPNNYWTILRHLDSSTLNTSNSPGVTLEINKKPLYMQPMDSLSKFNKSYPAFKGRNSTTGQPFWTLVDTGGYVQIGKNIGKGNPPKPKLVIKKTYMQAANGFDRPQIVYEYRNTVPDSLAQDIQIKDWVDPKIFGSIDTTDNAEVDKYGQISVNLDAIPYSQYAQRVIVRLNNDRNSTILPNDCSVFSVSVANAEKLLLSEKSDSCLALSSEIEPNSIDTLVPSVSVRSNILARQNTDEEITDDTISAGDTIEYKLAITNTSAEAIQGFVASDYIGDLLDYGEFNNDELTAQGAQYITSTKTINWGAGELAPKSETTKTFKFHLKNQLPSTNRPSLLNFSYDCRVSNTFGNTTSYAVNCPSAKILENLPQISRSSAFIISLSVLLMTIILYTANAILAKEARHIKKIYQQKNHG